jgi:signal peptidase I
VLTVMIFLGVQAFVAQPYRVEGGSMEATVLPDQYVLIDKLTPRWAAYARGDIVVLERPEQYPEPGNEPFIKRVIGVAGDHLQLEDGKVLVNGTVIDEPYVFTDHGVREPTDPTGGSSEWIVPPGDVFVMGDHREASADSRMFGPVEVRHVIGRAWLRYWPLNSFGILPASRT